MTNKATVIAVSGSTATVAVERTSACEGCHKKAEGQECTVCTLMGGSRTVTAQADNTIGAAVGDTVTVESDSGRMLRYAALVFLLPVFAALLFWFVSSRFTGSELLRLSFAAIGFAASFVCVRVYSRTVQKKRCDIVITEILKKGRPENDPENE